MTAPSAFPTFRGPEGLLAHYTTAEVAFEHVLRTGRLRLSPYGRMRDPAENKDVILGFGYAGDRAEDEVAMAYAGVLTTVKAIRDSMRVLSLTREVRDLQDTFGCCWARPRMWEQYGDVHRGACLLFEGDRLRLACHDQMPTQTSSSEPTLFMAPVNYTPRGIADSDLWGITAPTAFDPPRVRETVARYIDSNYRDFYLLKTDDWQAEHEYRIILRGDDADEFSFIEYRNALVGVILGERFPSFEVAGAKALCDAAGIPIRRIYWWQGRPRATSRLTPDGASSSSPTEPNVGA